MAKFDIVLWGASSFVGKLVAEYFVAHYVRKGNVKLALGGRSRTKLEALQAELGTELELLVGDALDQAFIDDMVAQTKLVISTVGPYALYGEALVKAVAEQGKDYCDLTGEPQWIWQMMQNYESIAEQSGARIMHCCGFDSIPSDLGVYFIQQQALEKFGKPCQQIRYRFKSNKSGFSGGTVASMIHAISQIMADKEKARLLKTPYALLSSKPDDLPYQKSVKSLEQDSNTGEYLVPFIMASINTKVVHRTNEKLNFPWKQSFLYDESMVVGKGLKGKISGIKFMLGLAMFGLLAASKWGRKFLERFLVPKPGEGPSEDVVKNGYFNVELIGQVDDKEIITKVTGQGDPGYGSTCKMISETALLLLAKSPEQTGVGFLTPASALQQELIQQLSTNADVSFSVKS